MRAPTRHETPVADEATSPTADDTPLLGLTGVDKVFTTGRVSYTALHGIDLAIDAGELIAVVGPSGSGKSTLLNIVTGIDRPSAGTVTVAGARLDHMNEEQLAAWRGENVGIVFQFFQLLPTLTAIENVMLPMDFAKLGSVAEREERARAKLALVGLEDKLEHLPLELSGGEQQRVAIARALACDPPFLVADEPTGNLDSENADRMMELLVDLNARGMTVLYVTHDGVLAERSHRVVELRDGTITTIRVP